MGVWFSYGYFGGLRNFHATDYSHPDLLPRDANATLSTPPSHLPISQRRISHRQVFVQAILF
jgi:hypothetical protein